MGSTDTINQSSQLAKQRRGRNRVFVLVLVWTLLLLAMMLLQLPIALGINWQKIGTNSVKPRNKAKQNR